MVPNIERGHSFRGVTAYLMHDKAQGVGPQPVTADRVGFAGLFNFVGDEAVSIEEASKVMALTVRDADQLKAAAGIRPGGRKAEKGPVWHASLSWDPSERPSDEEMVEAAHAMLDKVGLPLKSGYQTYIVQHTDTEHRHLHVVVNLVHPINGKQANPYRDLPKAQAWAHAYDKARGNVFCKDRAEKYDRQAPAASDRQAAFNMAAQPGTGAEPRDAARPRRDRKPRQTRPEWQARKEAGNDNRMAQGVAARLRTELNDRYARLGASFSEAADRRRAESARFFADLRAGRKAIYEKYAEALDDVWKGRQRGTPPSNRAAWTRLATALNAREATFLVNEGTLLGRLRNARILGRDLTPFRRARLALNQTERRRLFDQRQRAYKDRHKPDRGKAGQSPQPESKRALSDKVKAMRAAELSLYDRAMGVQRAAMLERHAAERAGEKAQRADLGQKAAELWRMHKAQYGRGAPGYAGRTPRAAGRQPDQALQRQQDGASGSMERSLDRRVPGKQEAVPRPANAPEAPSPAYARQGGRPGFDPNVSPDVFRKTDMDLGR